MKRFVVCMLAIVLCIPFVACAKKEVRSETPIPLSQEKHDRMIAVASEAVLSDLRTTWNANITNSSYTITELQTEDEEKEDTYYYEGKYYRVTATVQYTCDLKIPIPEDELSKALYSGYVQWVSEMLGYELLEDNEGEDDLNYWILKDVPSVAQYSVNLNYESDRAILKSVAPQQVFSYILSFEDYLGH